jgi:hypothetical protein
MPISPKPHGSYSRYRQFQGRQREAPALSWPGPGRALAAAKVAFDAWKGYFQATQGWYKSAAKDGYAFENVVPDVLAFHAGWCEAAKDICNTLCHEPTTLETDEDSESAGPATIGSFNGVAADLAASALSKGSGPTIPIECVMLRVRAGVLTVSLVGFKDVADNLSAGTYQGEIRDTRDGTKVADFVVVHKRKGRNPRLNFRA